MFPGMNPKNMEKVMKQLGMKTESINAKKVIIELEDKKIIFSNPEITKIGVKGQEMFQLQGNYSEEEFANEEDIEMIMEKASCSKEEAKKALEETGDIAEAIIKLMS